MERLYQAASLQSGKPRQPQSTTKHAAAGLEQTFAQGRNPRAGVTGRTVVAWNVDQRDKDLTSERATCANISDQFVDFMARLHQRSSSRSGTKVRNSIHNSPRHDPVMSRTFPCLIAFAVVWFLLAQLNLFAQNADVEDVHVAPKVETNAADKITEQKILADTVQTHAPMIRSKVDLVLVPVTVTDPMNRLVTGLDKENFEVFEGKDRQDVRHFSAEDAPISLGVIFDMSGSMSSKIERAREAVIEFFKTANPQDEFFLITFSDKPEEVSDFTQSVDDLQGKLVYTVPKGRTALLDAIYLGLSKMRQARYPKKSLLIISDGGDNHSRYTEGEIKSLVKEADVMVYSIGIYDHYFQTEEERLGPQLLGDISELSGGRSFTIDNPNDLADVATKIGIELRNQYVLGYRPKNPGHDGKWHKIKVKLLPPKGLPPLHVYAKTGYYASSQ
jgi:Ca-activated chloride channel family protein